MLGALFPLVSPHHYLTPGNGLVILVLWRTILGCVVGES